MKKVLSIILCSFIIIFSMFINIVKVKADNCDKYACATCSYYLEDKDSYFVFDIKSDGNGKVKVDFKVRMDAIDADLKKVKNNVIDSYFINSSSNKLECYPIYYIKYDGVYDNPSGNGIKITYDKSESTNNGKDVSKNKNDNLTCSFKDTKSGISCEIHQIDGKVSGDSIKCGYGNYPFVERDSDINFLNGADFKNCSTLGEKVFIYCDTTGGGCYIFPSDNVPEWIGTNHNNGTTSEGTDGNGDKIDQNNNSNNNVSPTYDTDKLDLCNDPDFLRILMLTKKVVSIITLCTALVLIIFGIINIAKTITDENADLSKSIKKFKNQLILAAIIFLAPALINWIFFTDNFITSKSDMLSECINNLSEKKIKELDKKLKDKINSSTPNINHGSNSNNSNNSNNYTPTTGRDTSNISYKPYNTDFSLKSGDLDLVSYINMWEGNTGFCGTNGYIAKNLGDGTITAGPGVTNYKTDVAKLLGYTGVFPMSAGDCVNKTVIDSIKLYTLETETKKVVDFAKQLDIELEDNQLISMVDISYNYGFGGAKNAIAAYKAGEANYKNHMKDLAVKGINQGYPGLAKRRDADYELFIYGVTDEVKKGYSRTIKYLK